MDFRNPNAYNWNLHVKRYYLKAAVFEFGTSIQTHIFWLHIISSGKGRESKTVVVATIVLINQSLSTNMQHASVARLQSKPDFVEPHVMQSISKVKLLCTLCKLFKCLANSPLLSILRLLWSNSSSTPQHSQSESWCFGMALQKGKFVPFRARLAACVKH